MPTEGQSANQNPQLDLNVQSDALTAPTQSARASSGLPRDLPETSQSEPEKSRPVEDFKQDVPSTSSQIPNSAGSPKSSNSPNSGRPVNGENSEEEDGNDNVKTDPGDGSKFLNRKTPHE